jgi:hypothetical protein
MQRITIAEVKRIGARTVTFVLAFSMAAFVASGVSQAKPPAWAQLDPSVCGGINGEWTPSTCTIPEGNSGVVSSRFKIGKGITLDIKGSLTIPRGMTVASSGTIIVENTGGVVPGDFDPWGTGVLVYGHLDNSGTITVQNVYEGTSEKGTEGITVSVAIDATDQNDPNTFEVVPGALTNSGTIIIQNRAHTRGIKILGTMTNSASGAILVANSLTTSVGIYNRREEPYPKFVTNGTLTNAGSITIANSGDYNGFGIYNQGLFTNSASGEFTINEPPEVAHDAAVGFWNGGSFTNFGKFTNDRGVYAPPTVTWGSFNPAGTMIIHGTTSARGTFYNSLIMINLGTITSHGLFADESTGATMINYGTFYNYGFIGGGVNKGICIDEKSTNPSADGC